MGRHANFESTISVGTRFMFRVALDRLSHSASHHRVYASAATTAPLLPRWTRVCLTRPFHASSKFNKKKSSSGKMPPKKGPVESKVLLGRPSNNLKMGVVGLPNGGSWGLAGCVNEYSVNEYTRLPMHDV